MKERVKAGRVVLVGENRKEEHRSSNCVEDTGRTQLMRGIDRFHRRIAGGKDQLVVVSQERGETAPEEDGNTQPVVAHEVHEGSDVNGQPPTQNKDEDVVEHPVVQTVHKERFKPGAIRKAIDEDVEAHAEAGPVVKRKLCDEQQREADGTGPADHPDPERHQQIEPEKDDQEIQLVFRIAEEQDRQQVQWIREADSVEQAVMGQIEYRPDKVRNQYGLETALQEVPIVERCIHIEIVEQAESGDEEKDWYTEAAGNLEQGNQVDIGRCIVEIL